MASSILGDSLDIHTGGIDLKFPHHDNELAQAEAYFDNNNWVRYFLHSGHLTISGCKMSKSLKNFITIKDALKQHTARQLRFAFLLHNWKDSLDYSANTMEMAVQCEKTINEFFLTVKDILKNNPKCPSLYPKWGDEELELNNKLFSTQESVHECLCDNIDTRGSLDRMRELITATNTYIRRKQVAKDRPDGLVLLNVAKYLTRVLDVFGLMEGEESVGFRTVESRGVDVEQMAMPYLMALAEFREKVRQIARQEKAEAILTLCDELRNDILPNVGVRLEDHEGQPPVVKLVDRETLLKEREQKMKAEEQKRIEKERKKREQAEAQAAKDAQRRIPPWELFTGETDKYSKFDDKGMPTHDLEGKEVSKGQLKKLAKLYQQQEKRYAEFVESNSQVNGVTSP
jgi:cysteinyl-tRNA synthetase